jgi:hypothetical protein
MNGKLKAKKKLTKRKKLRDGKFLMHTGGKGGKPEKNIDDKKLF